MPADEQFHRLSEGTLEAETGRRGRRRRYLWIVGLVLCVGFLLRFIALDRLPLPAHQDELSDIYDGYCIAMTGADRAGDP